MAIYAVGDVQGCYDELRRLVDLVRFDPARDELWFVGDLVNRGPKSLEVLRMVHGLGDRAHVVLGNHDLHLIALGTGTDRQGRGREPELDAVLAAPDAAELIDWLRHRPLAHYRPDLNTLLVHAGVAPQWDPLSTVKYAREVEQALRGADYRTFLASLYGNEPASWSAALTGFDRLRFIVNCLTRARFFRRDGSMDLAAKGSPAGAPDSLLPWFEFPQRATAAVRVVFGHWSALGLLEANNLLALDTGCVWGGSLTAVRLDGPARTWSVPSRGYRPVSAD